MSKLIRGFIQLATISAIELFIKELSLKSFLIAFGLYLLANKLENKK